MEQDAHQRGNEARMSDLDPTLAVEAIRLIDGDRAQTYGPPNGPNGNLTRIAVLWSGYLGQTITAEDVAWMMVLTKASRARSSFRRDNYVDAIAYTLLAEQCAE